MTGGMSRETGQVVDGVALLRQSVHDILTTPVGSRVINREYGSRLFELLDAPVDQRFTVELFQAVAEAIDRWEPRYIVKRVRLVEMRDNGPVFDLIGIDRDSGIGVVLEGV